MQRVRATLRTLSFVDVLQVLYRVRILATGAKRRSPSLTQMDVSVVAATASHEGVDAR